MFPFISFLHFTSSLSWILFFKRSFFLHLTLLYLLVYTQTLTNVHVVHVFSCTGMQIMILMGISASRTLKVSSAMAWQTSSDKIRVWKLLQKKHTTRSPIKQHVFTTQWLLILSFDSQVFTLTLQKIIVSNLENTVWPCL